MVKNIKNAFNNCEKKDLFIIAVFFIFACYTLFDLFSYSAKDFIFCDFDGQWKITALFLRGVDPYLQIGSVSPEIPSIGTVPEGWGTSPWGFLLGNIFYPGYLSYNNAKIYFNVLTFIVLSSTAIIILMQHRKNKDISFIIVFLFALISDSFFCSLLSGNAGMLCCCLLIISCFICESHPYISGILLAFSMTKPQCAVLICVAMLLNKKIKPLITGAVLVIISFLSSGFILKKSPIELINEFLKSDIGSGNQNFGIFDFINTCFGIDPLKTMFSSMVFGLVLCVILVTIFIKKIGTSQYPWIVYSIPCIITTFWSYSWGLDNYILILPCIACLFIFFNANSLAIKCTFVFTFFWLYFEHFIQKKLLYLLNEVLWITFPKIAQFNFNVGFTFLYNVISLVILVLDFALILNKMNSKNGNSIELRTNPTI